MTGERQGAGSPHTATSAPKPASSGPVQTGSSGPPPGAPAGAGAGGVGEADETPPEEVEAGVREAEAGVREAGVQAEVREDEVQEAELVEEDIARAEEVLRRERDEYLDMLRRVQADFENYKKRMMRQQTDLLERAAEGLVARLLPVLDAFELARTHLEAEGSAESKALLQAASLLSDTLAKEGLERLDDDGAAFDPTRHEAVEHQPAGPAGGDEGHEGPVVSEVLRPGYRYKGKVIRPAMVRVRG
jgi:molecular chaperone GrpE